MGICCVHQERRAAGWYAVPSRIHPQQHVPAASSLLGGPIQRFLLAERVQVAGTVHLTLPDRGGPRAEIKPGSWGR